VSYSKRLVDHVLDEWLSLLPAIAVEGAKGVGKTATAARRADTVYSLDKRATRLSIEQNPEIVTDGASAIFIDEWQLVPDVWDVVRRAVDDGAEPGRFLLAGSAGIAPGTRIHSGAARIVRLMMRPLSLPERRIAEPTVSLTDLLEGSRPSLEGSTNLTTNDYVDEILASGFPGIRSRPQKAHSLLLSNYLDQIVDHDIVEAGGRVHRPIALRGWLAAYGAASSTTASYASILQAATPGEDDKPAKQTGMAYRDLLQRLWVLDPLPSWSPVFSHLKRLGQAPKHHLVDPALAATLVGATRESLLRGEGPMRNDDTFLGALFESLAVQTVRVLASCSQARVAHLRTAGGKHEVDMIVERADHRVVAIEVKVSTSIRPGDVAHLNWLETQIPDRVVDKVILYAGPYAYRRPDGVGVVPLALLGL